MPRPRNNALYINFDQIDGKIVCKNDNCDNKVLHSHTANLERHLKAMHPNLYNKYIEKKDVQKQNVQLNKKVNSFTLNRANIELALVDLFVKRPFNMIKDEAFKVLTEPVLSVLNINLNNNSIRERIVEFSQKLKTEIKEDLKCKLLSLKIDAATRHDLSVLGVNVQYIKNKCVQIKTLAVKELKSSHTGEYLKTIILDILKEYDVNINQILTITTDNGANMLKAVKNLNEDLQSSMENEVENDTADSETEDEDVAPVFSEERLESIRLNFASYNITGVRCGAHTLQLCVYDVIKNAEIKMKLDKCRSVVKKLRTQNYLIILKNGRYKKPLLDCLTRWNSTFIMLERLLEIRDIVHSLIDENNSLHLSPDDWSFICEFVETFKPIYFATMKLQSEQQCFSELYIILMEITIQLENLKSTEMTNLLIDSLNKRKAKLFENELLNAAVFLDPRIKICLSAEQKDKAKKYITSLHERMNSLKGNLWQIFKRNSVKIKKL